jgi:hypothetical protein
MNIYIKLILIGLIVSLVLLYLTTVFEGAKKKLEEKLNPLDTDNLAATNKAIELADKGHRFFGNLWFLSLGFIVVVIIKGIWSL